MTLTSSDSLPETQEGSEEPSAVTNIKWIRWLHQAENIFLCLLVITMLVLAVWQIVLRNVFDSGLLWAESFVRILVLWIAMVGAMVASRDNNHIKIDVLNHYLPPKAQYFTQGLVLLFSAAICGLLASASYKFVEYELLDQTEAFSGIPAWYFELIMPVGFAIISLRYLRLTIMHWIER